MAPPWSSGRRTTRSLPATGGGGAGTGGEGGADGAKAATDTHAGVPIPRPMDVEEPEWDVQGDCVPLPPWKVRRRAGLTCSFFKSGRYTFRRDGAAASSTRRHNVHFCFQGARVTCFHSVRQIVVENRDTMCTRWDREVYSAESPQPAV